MFCIQCGKEIDNGAKFCPHCGAAAAASVSGPAPGPDGAGGGPYHYNYGGDFRAAGNGTAPVPPPTPPEDREKRGKKGLIIGGGIAAVVVVAALLIAALSGLFSSPKGRVGKALAKTLAAHAEASEKMGLPDVAGLFRDKSVSQRLSVELTGVNGEVFGEELSALEGLGLSLGVDYDQKGRKAGAEAAAFWGSDEIVSFQMLVDDNVLSLASPQFTQGDAYGLDTETLGETMAQWGIETEDDSSVTIEEIGFNLFDLVDQYGSESGDTGETLAEAGKRLADAIEVEDNGKKKIDVNGNRVDAGAYRVTIPQEALEDYIDALEDVWKQENGREAMEGILRSFGVNEDAIGEIASGAASYGELADTLRQFSQGIGDVKVDVYLDGGYVCAMEYSIARNGSRLELGLYLGGGDSYVDDASFRFAANGAELLVESTGSHGGKDGVFTDETALRISSGEGTTWMTSKFSYEPKAQSDNFEWTLSLEDVISVKAVGQLTAGTDSLDLQMHDVALEVTGTEVCSLSVAYSIGPCRGVGVSLPAPTLLGGMSGDDLLELMDDIEDNAYGWAYDVMDKIPPELYNYLF